MTTQDLTLAALPYARYALRAARPAIIGAVGRAGWIVLWPVWSVVTGPMLRVLTRIAIELGIGLLGPRLVPILELFDVTAVYVSDADLPEASREFLGGLIRILKTPREQMSESVQLTLALTPGALVGDGGTQP